MTLREYQKINRSFKRICIYRIGNEAGFFSEINNMLIAMVYCLEHRLQFRLCSANSNFGNDIWKDYFSAFTLHSTRIVHFLYNERPYIHKRPHSITVNQLFLFKKELAKQILTQDIWPYIRDKSKYNVDCFVSSSLIKGSLTYVTSKLIECIWRYNRYTNTQIKQLIRSLDIPQNYGAVFIRHGDKERESPHGEIQKYVDKINEQCDQNNLPVFIGSDDFRVINEIKLLCPNRTFYHFNFDKDEGYFMDNFLNNYTRNEQKCKIIQLLAQIEIFKRAAYFISSYTTNVSVFVGMARDCNNCYDINNDRWVLW